MLLGGPATLRLAHGEQSVDDQLAQAAYDRVTGIIEAYHQEKEALSQRMQREYQALRARRIEELTQAVEELKALKSDDGAYLLMANIRFNEMLRDAPPSWSRGPDPDGIVPTPWGSRFSESRPAIASLMQRRDGADDYFAVLYMIVAEAASVFAGCKETGGEARAESAEIAAPAAFFDAMLGLCQAVEGKYAANQDADATWTEKAFSERLTPLVTTLSAAMGWPAETTQLVHATLLGTAVTVSGGRRQYQAAAAAFRAALDAAKPAQP